MIAIPTIDLTPLWNNPTSGIYTIAAELKEKLAPIGFVYLTNHSISENLIAAMFTESHRFHALPLETKLKIKQNDFFRGYVPNKASQIKISTEGSATKPNLVDSFAIMHEVPEHHPDYQAGLYFAGPNQWPENLPGFKATICQYRDEMVKLSQQLIKAFAIALGMLPNGLDNYFIDPTYFLRLQHYPEQQIDTPDDQFGIAPHTDAGFMTILAQDSVGGLEVKLSDGSWIAAPYIPNTFVLNAGSMLPRFSNDIFRAVPHRVINRSHKARYSIPFFFDTNMHATVEVLPSCITPERPARYKPINYGDSLVERLQANYGVGRGK